MTEQNPEQPTAREGKPAPCRPLVVLGMHRSGTSLLGGLLADLGVAMGERLIPADQNNPVGYFEDALPVARHEAMLQRLDRVWHGPRGMAELPPRWWQDAAHEEDVDRLRRYLRERIASGVDWGFKDPRTSRFLPLWQHLFAEVGLAPRYLLAVRHPGAVADSETRRDGVPADTILQTWLRYNHDAVIDAGDRLLGVFDYDRWFTAPTAQITRLATVTGCTENAVETALAGRLQHGLRRSDPDRTALPDWAMAVYRDLADRAEQPPDEPAATGRLRRRLSWHLGAVATGATAEPLAAGADPTLVIWGGGEPPAADDLADGTGPILLLHHAPLPEATVAGLARTGVACRPLPPAEPVMGLAPVARAYHSLQALQRYRPLAARIVPPELGYFAALSQAQGTLPGDLRYPEGPTSDDSENCPMDRAASDFMAASVRQLAAAGPGPATPPEAGGVHVSVCLTHYNRPAALRLALESLAGQRDVSFEVIVVDDGSSLPGIETDLAALDDWLTAHGWRLVRQDNRYLGAARNRAAAEATGDYLFFMDDDNAAASDQMLARFVGAARATGADVVTGSQARFESDAADQPAPPAGAPAIAIYPFLGGWALGGIVTNVFGDAHSLIRRQAFEAVGGFTEDVGVGHEDWELFARLCLGGYTLTTVPEPLYWYRVSPTSMLAKGRYEVDLARGQRPYREALPNALETLPDLLFAQWEDGRTRRAARARFVAEQVRNLTEQVGDLEQAVHSSQQDLAKAQRQRAETEAHAAHLIQHLRRMESSLSWRLTKPLRWIVRHLRRRDPRR